MLARYLAGGVAGERNPAEARLWLERVLAQGIASPTPRPTSPSLPHRWSTRPPASNEWARPRSTGSTEDAALHRGGDAHLDPELVRPVRRHHRRGVRFAFWGAEERGLIGSRHHVGSLSEEARRHVALYINLERPSSF